MHICMWEDAHVKVERLMHFDKSHVRINHNTNWAKMHTVANKWQRNKPISCKQRLVYGVLDGPIQLPSR